MSMGIVCSRSFALLLVTALLAIAAAQSAAAPSMRYNVSFGSMEMEGAFEVHQQVVDLPPGAQSAVHMHGGPELVLVLEGEVTLLLEEEGSETTYGAGETYSVPADTYLQVRNTTEAPASFVVTFLLPAGATLTTPR